MRIDVRSRPTKCDSVAARLFVTPYWTLAPMFSPAKAAAQPRRNPRQGPDARRLIAEHPLGGCSTASTS
jgi:hypothetical protein